MEGVLGQVGNDSPKFAWAGQRKRKLTIVCDGVMSIYWGSDEPSCFVSRGFAIVCDGVMSSKCCSDEPWCFVTKFTLRNSQPCLESHAGKRMDCF